MEVADNARKDAVADLDIGHAVRNAIRVLSQGDRDLYIGADRAGRLLEVVVIEDDGGSTPWTRQTSPAQKQTQAVYVASALRSATATSQAELAQVVADARQHGHTWTQIATMLGTSRQAAQERYGEPAVRP